MTQFVHLLTTAAILVHSTLGCCAHEALGIDENSRGRITCCDVEDHDHQVEEKISAVQPTALELSSVCDHQPHQPTPHECCHENCTWPSPKVRDNADVLFPDLSAKLHWSLDTFDLLLVSGASVFIFPAEFYQHTLPVRPHLAKCVLLI